MPRKPKAGVPAEATLTLRMTDADRAHLDRLVAMRAAELAEMGADEADVSAASFVRALIRREAKAKGLLGPPTSTGPSGHADAPPALPAPASPKSSAAEEPDAKAIHAAFLRAIKGGKTQVDIAKRSGVDRSALSKFKKSGSGLSAEKLRALRSFCDAL